MRRCAALCKKDMTKVELLAALNENRSVPPTGRGTGLNLGVERSVPVPQSLECTFPRGSDLGLVFGRTALEAGGESILVLCYSKIQGGSKAGPCSHSGDTIFPGDEVLSVSGATGRLITYLTPAGEFVAKDTDAPLTFKFRRDAYGAIDRDFGGRPEVKKPKFARAGDGAGSLLGGSLASKNTKSRRGYFGSISK